MNKGIYFASFTALLWGFLAIALKISLYAVSPITVTWFRFTIAFITLLIYYLIFDRKKISLLAHPPKLALIAAVFLTFNYLGFITGIHLTSPIIGQIFIQTGPMMLAISGFIIFKEKVNIRQAIGLVIVSLGMLIFYNEQILNIAGGLKEYKLGVLVIVLGALSWVGYSISNKFAVRKYHPMQLNLIIFGLPSLLLLPWVDFGSIAKFHYPNVLIALFLGLNTLGAYGALAYAFKYLEANKISVIITLNPLITFILMAWLSNKQVSWIKPETFSLITIMGALTVLTGVILTVLKKNKLKVSRKAIIHKNKN